MNVSAPPFRPKLVYFAERHPSLDAIAFTARWRRHARLGMGMPRWRNIERYVHCDPLIDLPLPFATLACDGIALLWYQSEGHRQLHIADTSARETMQRDEAGTFARSVRDFSFLGEEIVLTASAGVPFRLFIAVRRHVGVPESVFAQYRVTRHAVMIQAGLATLSPSAFDYTQNHAVDADRRTGFDLDFDGIDEIGLPAMPKKALAQDLGHLLNCAYASRELSWVAGLWTRQVVLYDRSALPDS